MKTIRIYHPGKIEPGKIEPGEIEPGKLEPWQTIQLDKSASNHLVRVLRLKNQQEFILFNGEGGEYTATLEINGKSAAAHIHGFNSRSSESKLNIHLLQGISKGDRMDFVMQKSVELGVKQITPIICERTVVNLKADRSEKKLQHWQSIAISACEQSGRNSIPQISPAITFRQAMQEESDSLKLLLDPLSSSNLHKVTVDNNQLTLLIGPEGGLSETEIKFARDHGFRGVSLGPRILRTETAALAAITSAQLLWGDLG